VVELESLAACLLAMARAATVDEIETATLAGLLELVDVEVAYTARREQAVWTISAAVGLEGDFAAISIPDGLVPYADALRAGNAICYESPADMLPELAKQLAGLGLRSLYAAPIMRAETCVGALAIGRPRPSLFDERDRVLLRLFTSYLSTLFGKRELIASLETLSESVPPIVFRTDAAGWINWYNHRWYEYTGQTPEEAAGWGWQTAIFPVDFQRIINTWPSAIETGQPATFDYRLRRSDGIYQWHLSQVEPVRDEKGSIIGWCGTITNIEVQKQTLERAKRVADSLQDAFLPQSLPTRGYLRLDASYVAAETDALVGGDWYDAFDLPDGRLCFSIGDVAGHGLAASMQVGKLRQSIYTLALDIDDPAEILAGVNRVLMTQEPGLFVTALVGFLDSDGMCIRYATAGHPPPIVAYKADRPATLLSTGGLPLGVAASLELSNHSVPVLRDMVFVLYTDGVTEFAHDLIGGEARLRGIIPTLVGNSELAHPARTVYDAVLDGCSPRDDTAMLILQFSQTCVMASKPIPETARDMHWRFHASDAQAAHAARREVGAYMERIAGKTEQTFMSELVVGELLANTVEHAPGLVDLTIEWTHDHVVLTVSDRGPGLRTLRRDLPGSLLHEGSRGLFLVHELSGEVTVGISRAGGAEIRVVLPIVASSLSHARAPAVQ
jgi:PAS domain S-box-containing protein